MMNPDSWMFSLLYRYVARFREINRINLNSQT